MEPQTPAPQQPLPTQPITEDPGKGLGIAGLIFAFLIPLVGLILSIIGVNMSKKAGYKNKPGVIGIVVGALFVFLAPVIILIIVFLSVPALQRNNRKTVYKNNVAQIQAGLSNYRASNTYYPNSLDQLTNVSKDTLTPPYLGTYQYTTSPIGCTTSCTGYTLVATFEDNSQETVSSN
jgi:hypothetical protein